MKNTKEKKLYEVGSEVQSPGIELSTFGMGQHDYLEPLTENRKKKEDTLLPFPLASKGKSFWTSNLVNKYLNLATCKKKILL